MTWLLWVCFLTCKMGCDNTIVILTLLTIGSRTIGSCDNSMTFLGGFTTYTKTLASTYEVWNPHRSRSSEREVNFLLPVVSVFHAKASGSHSACRRPGPTRQAKSLCWTAWELGDGRAADRETVNENHSREGFPKFVWTRSSERWLYLKPVIW